MTWNFRVLRHFDNGEEFFSIHEVRYNDDGTLVDYIQEPASPISDITDGIADILMKMAQALNKPILEEKDFEKELRYTE